MTCAVVCVRSVRAVLVDNVKQTGLEAFLYSRGLHYSTITLDHLTSTFELPLARVRSIVSDLIFSKVRWFRD